MSEKNFLPTRSPTILGKEILIRENVRRARLRPRLFSRAKQAHTPPPPSRNTEFYCPGCSMPGRLGCSVSIGCLVQELALIKIDFVVLSPSMFFYVSFIYYKNTRFTRVSVGGTTHCYCTVIVIVIVIAIVIVTVYELSDGSPNPLGSHRAVDTHHM